ncbi:MAG: hypothetical protein JKY65_08515 [Planctomycetes bacterium]|nr:hypothetical protein [Planctomycetota bacterium]
MTKRHLLPCLLAALCLIPAAAHAGGSFAEEVGEVAIGPVKEKEAVELPYLTWGGDAATFLANGGPTTQANSIYGKLGLKVQLVAGDDFVGQVRRYLAGETPFLRGTVRMIGMASEVIGPTKPVMFLQLTWSVGDHMVGRAELKTLNGLKGKKIALQRGGPHVGMLDDALRAAGLGWSDIEPVWVKELTGAGGPAAKFQQDASIAACMVISPDMFALCTSLTETGTGEGGTLKGAHVVVSTAHMSRSIADVYVCRRDYYDAHKDVVEKITAGYLKACEELLNIKSHYEAKPNPSDDALTKRRNIMGKSSYQALLEMTQSILGKDVLPSLEDDVHGLISDCSFVGLPGNVSFFTNAGNLSGFAAKRTVALDLAVKERYAQRRVEYSKHDLDYAKVITLAGLKAKTTEEQTERFKEVKQKGLFAKGAAGTLVSFDILFDGNQHEFSVERYGADFKRAIEGASVFGNAVLAIGGHAGTPWLLDEVVKAGKARGVLTRSGTSYLLRGKPFNLEDLPAVVKEIDAGTFGKGPQNGLAFLLKLSEKRAKNVRETLIRFAAKKGYRLDPSQIKSVGVGVLEPAVPYPTTNADKAKNRRVEFRLVRVQAEAIGKGAGMFDY